MLADTEISEAIDENNYSNSPVHDNDYGTREEDSNPPSVHNDLHVLSMSAVNEHDPVSVETNIESIDDGLEVEASSDEDYNYDMSFTSEDEDYQLNEGKKDYNKSKKIIQQD